MGNKLRNFIATLNKTKNLEISMKKTNVTRNELVVEYVINELVSRGGVDDEFTKNDQLREFVETTNLPNV